jgi:hypothetical protein
MTITSMLLGDHKTEGPNIYPLGIQILIKTWRDGSPRVQHDALWKGPYCGLPSTYSDARNIKCQKNSIESTTP